MSKSIYQAIKTDPDSLVGKTILYDYGNGEKIRISIADSNYKVTSMKFDGVVTEFDLRTVTSCNGIQYLVYENNALLL